MVYKPCDYYTYDALTGSQVTTRDGDCDTALNPAWGPVSHGPGGGFVAVEGAALLRPDLSLVYPAPLASTRSNAVVDREGNTYVADAEGVVAIGIDGELRWREPVSGVNALVLSEDGAALYVFGNRTRKLSLTQMCDPCSRFCQRSSVMRCADDGLSASLVETCAAPQTCGSGACRLVCDPGQTSCEDGQTLLRCDAEGGAWELHERCADGYRCLDGERQREPAPACQLQGCSTDGFSYTCGSGSYEVTYSYCANGNVGGIVVAYSNGHTVRCSFGCSGLCGSCQDDTGASCHF